MIGTSAGGIEPLKLIVAEFPKNFPVAIFVVVHLPSWHRSELDEPTRVEFRLEPSAGGTRLTLMHTGESDSMARGRYSSGWPIKLSNLGSLLAKTD